MKILIALVSCHKNTARRNAQRNTWLPNLKEDYKFFLGDGSNELAEDEVQLDCPDDYFNLPKKIKAIIIWALERGYDYIFKCDDDVYVFPDRLLVGEFYKYSYTGRFLNRPNSHEFGDYASGFAYWLREDAAKIILSSEISDSNEDRWVGKTLHLAKVSHYNDKMYVVLSMKPKPLWGEMSKQASVCCQFEPEDMQLLHGIITGTTVYIPPVKLGIELSQTGKKRILQMRRIGR